MANDDSRFQELDSFQNSIIMQRRGAISEGHWTLSDGTASKRSTTDTSAGQLDQRAGDSTVSSTDASSSHPTRTHSTIRFSDGYRDAWKQRHRPKMHSPPAESRGKWEGIWLARGTLRRSESEEKERSEDIWRYVWRKLRTKAVDIQKLEDR